MSSNNGYEKYKKVDVSTASQNRLIVMLYDGAIKFLETACAAMDKKHGTEEAHNNIVKAQEIIYELLSSLNYEAGDIAHRLASIYTYMNQKLTEGNISKTKPPLLEVIRYLKELKTAWEGVEEQMSKANTENKTSANNNSKDNSSSSSNTDSKLNITG
ncbi:flagellar export chaperone FliS [Brachyspira hyodysenteriae]|uniref:flagellar export chaperone FliS n=1 Tax=Brachyspira hyodysenteriae TaxID=159 RepID=UPI00063DA380|nr:flagellar export chaperone FliS [Brachyspira hyodysenteriae]KLI30550.1 flagellar biosynthesis protein FliS [Brachyspira hyodysenteriae]KLI32091.1 flagellar biosynthesis protein FliS [Brachyspira hyodysenteriae]MDA0035880.1 flagellar export chaperone FliS [Brachyspira hyodysenteriae]MDA0049969.1 flagellar export chaperone FliS [Brachyspira hyodysenteriae]MDA0063123.1 flagellar export chaperone FliS [Brachyspira hyodysenteriae]